MKRLRAALAAGSLLAAGGVPATAQAGDSVPAERLAARRWFSDAKFGLFIHWGVYSQLGAGEWVMHNRKIAVSDYDWLATTFNPTKFDAVAWVALAKRAGVRYITTASRCSRRRRRRTTSSTGRRSGGIRSRSSRTPATRPGSSCSSTTHNSTGITPIIGPAAGRRGTTAAPTTATGAATSRS